MKRICLKCGNYTDGATCPYCKPTWKERALEDKLVEELCKKRTRQETFRGCG